MLSAERAESKYMIGQISEPDNQSVAIIGMAARFPGAPDVETYWDNIKHGVESVAFFTDEELEADGIGKATLADPTYVKASATIPDIDLFDAEYFNYSPKEAQFIDPQQRLFLECALHALESSGYDPARYQGSIGAFGGAAINIYQISLIAAHHREIQTSGALRTLFINGNDKDHLTTRASYKLHLRGPSLGVQTACSTSLVAVHVACQSVLSGECDMALAGGVSVMRGSRKAGYYFVDGGIQSPDGHCRPFDAAARGTVFGDGVGIVVLKRLEQALADSDTIHAIIRGSAINNDGSGKVGYTAPSVNGQAAAIAEALAVAGVDVDSIGYVEAHGTGTELGDPVEIAALNEVFAAREFKKQRCAIGSVKGNIGHLNTASGIAGLIKAVLALKHGFLPPSINFKQPNPNIDFENSPFYVNTSAAAWPARNGPRRAGVSSFGIGGTNAHVVLEEAPRIAPPPSARQEHVLLLSARTPAALERATKNLCWHLQRSADVNIADVACTLSSGRKSHRYARAVVCRNSAEAASLLETHRPGAVFDGERSAQARPVAFMFPGQGSQRPKMGRDLYRHEPVFRAEIDRCSELLAGSMGMDLRRLLLADADDPPLAADRLTETQVAQPAIFVVSLALAKLWMAWGVLPNALIGHSIGELVAASLAGVFTLEDALIAVSARGRLMQQMPKGAMAGVGGSIEDVKPYLRGGLAVAAINAPNSCVVSGPLNEIAELEMALRRDRIPVSRLRTSHAFHSAMMAPAIDPFVKILGGMKLRTPSIPFVSNVTGKWITPGEATDPHYWGRQLRQTVLFADGVRTIGERHAVLLEVGAGRTLTTLALNAEDSSTGLAVASLPRSADGNCETRGVLQAAAQLWLAGAQVDWPRLYHGEARRKVPLPPYPFERKRYWVDAKETGIAKADWPPTAPSIDDAFSVVSWRRLLRAPTGWKLGDLGNSTWLVFAGDDRFSRELTATLAARCGKLVVVSIAEAFTERDDGELRFTLSPAKAEHFDVLAARLSRLNKQPDIVVYLWSMLGNAAARGEPDQAIDRTFFGPLHVLRAWQRADTGKRTEFATVVCDTEDVLGNETVTPLGAVARGPCQVGNLECGNIRCRYIDVSSTEINSTGRAEIIELMIRDLAAPARYVVVAYRRQHIWTAERQPIKLAASEPTSVLRAEGLYLITGGLGAIGLALARALSERATAKLVLVGRTQLPDRAEWDRYLAEAHASDKTRIAIHAIRDIETNGSQVMIGVADVSDLAAMRMVVKQAEARFGAIDGVIHAAGAGSSLPIAYADRPNSLKVLRPKVQGTLVLENIFRRRELDFFVLFSSISALRGYLGHASYSAANAFLDAFARGNSLSRRGRTISINWDLWNEIGMVLRSEIPEQLRAAHTAELKDGIKTAEGIDALFRILQSEFTQVLVSRRGCAEQSGDMDGPAAPAQPPQPQEEIAQVRGDVSLPAYGKDQRHPRPELRQDYVAPATELEQIVAEMWAESLSLERVGIRDDFFELGGHSLLALQLLPRLRNRFQVELTPRDFFVASTVAGVSQVIEEKLIAEIEQMGELEALEAGE